MWATKRLVGVSGMISEGSSPSSELGLWRIAISVQNILDPSIHSHTLSEIQRTFIRGMLQEETNEFNQPVTHRLTLLDRQDAQNTSSYLLAEVVLVIMACILRK